MGDAMFKKLLKRFGKWLGLSVAQDAVDEVQKRLDREKKKSKKG